ncbi:MAG: restriction endonuclease subunit S [Caldisericaceae bacterium]|nr:restriction endonuclease subunit S [Caldisericaceae bacterium]
MKNGWKIKKLSEVCSVIAGQSPEGKYYNANSDGLPFYQGKKGFKDKYIEEPTKWTTKVTKEAIAGDILMSVRAPVGPVNFSTQRICIGRGLAAIRATELIDKNFLFYFFIKHENEIVGNEGVVFNSINKTQIENLNVPLPPIPEQKRIVKILDEAFAAIDKAKANAEKNLQNSRELFDSYLNKVFAPSAGLRLSSAEVSGQRNPGEDWEEKKLGECFKLKSGDGLTSKNMSREGNIPVYGGNGIAGSHNEYNLSGSNVIVGRVGALCGNARHINENIWLTDNAFKVINFKYEFDNSFLTYLLNYKNLKSYARQAAQPVISNSSLQDVKLYFPHFINEQKQIVKKLDGISSESKKLETIYQQKLSDLEELKKSILQKAFDGELTIENG